MADISFLMCALSEQCPVSEELTRTDFSEIPSYIPAEPDAVFYHIF